MSYEAGAGRTIREIASSSCRSPTTVARYVSLARSGQQQPKEPDTKSALEQVIRHFVLYCLLRNPLVSGALVSSHLSWIGLQASRAKVNRIARDLNFVSVYQSKREKLTARHKAYRVEFAREIQAWHGFVLPWVFTDESMIVKNPEKKKIRVIRGIHERGRFVEFEGYPTKVMVWACIGPGFKSRLVRVEGTLNAQGYVKLLEDSGIIAELDARYGPRAFVWQQDGARPHTAATTKLFLKNRMTLLPDNLQWPARSPDLSVIENFWEIVKSQIDYDAVTDATSLFVAASRAWDDVGLDSVTRAVRDFSARLNTCIAVKGECLNEHQRILRGFRVSMEEGERALKEDKDSDYRLEAFQQASLNFFLNRVRMMTPKARFAGLNEMCRQQAVAVNNVIASESVEIVRLLPEKLQRKLGASQPS